MKQPDEFKHYCLFGEPWWLDAAAGSGCWDEIGIESGGKWVARLPFILRKNRLGITTIAMPPLTQTLGPWFRPIERKYASELAVQKDLVDKLLAKLPKHDVFRQHFHHTVTNWLPWYWHGYSQTTRYSYTLNDITDEDKIWDGMQSNIRSDIRKAQTRFRLSIRHDVGVDALCNVCQKTFQRQNQAGLDESIVRRIYDSCEKRNAGLAFFAVDETERVHAVAYLVWDARTAYYLLGGGDPDLRNSGAHSLIMWEAIKYASKVSAAFDFEGSMLESVERFFRGFGAQQVPYHSISKIPNKYLNAFRNIRATVATLRT